MLKEALEVWLLFLFNVTAITVLVITIAKKKKWLAFSAVLIAGTINMIPLLINIINLGKIEELIKEMKSSVPFFALIMFALIIGTIVMLLHDKYINSELRKNVRIDSRY